MEVTSGLNWKGEKAGRPRKVGKREQELCAKAQEEPEQP